MTKLRDLIIKSAEKGIKLQAKEGSMPAGSNGPWKNKDTPVRNTSHWLITFLKSYEYTKKRKFKIAAKKCADYLASKKTRPLDGSFFCRENHLDPSNGLIGQAWVIEALSLASNILKNPLYKKIAKQVFLMHVFNKRLGLWYNTDLKGKPKNINLTLNQQLMFAAVGFMLIESFKKDVNIRNKINNFLGNLDNNLEIYPNGLIHHEIYLKNNKNAFKKIISHAYYLRNNLLNKSKKELSIGYHSFCLYGFSLLKKECALINSSFWKTPKFKKILEYTLTLDFLKKLSKNKFAFSYNPAGFEIAYGLKTFSNCSPLINKKVKKLINMQIKNHYDLKEGLMCKNTSDKITLSSRVYEAARLVDIGFNPTILSTTQSSMQLLRQNHNKHI